MLSKSDNVEMIYDKADEVIVELFELLLNGCQIGFETSTRVIRGNNFIFGFVNFLHYKWMPYNLKRSGSNIDSPDCIKTKKTTINPINDDDKYFQYTATIVLNHNKNHIKHKSYQKLSLL